MSEKMTNTEVLEIIREQEKADRKKNGSTKNSPKR